MCATSGSSQFSIQSFLFKTLRSRFFICCRNYGGNAVVTIPHVKLSLSLWHTFITDVRQIIYSVSCCWIFQSQNQRDMLVELLGFCSGVFGVSCLLAYCATLLGDCCSTLRDRFVVQSSTVECPMPTLEDETQHCPKNSGRIHPVTRRDIPDELKFQIC